MAVSDAEALAAIHRRLDLINRRLDVLVSHLSATNVVPAPRLHVWQPSWIDELEISQRLRTALKDHIRDKEHFIKLVNSGQFKQLHNVGKLTMEEAKRVVAEQLR